MVSSSFAISLFLIKKPYHVLSDVATYCCTSQYLRPPYLRAPSKVRPLHSATHVLHAVADRLLVHPVPICPEEPPWSFSVLLNDLTFKQSSGMPRMSDWLCSPRLIWLRWPLTNYSHTLTGRSLPSIRHQQSAVFVVDHVDRFPDHSRVVGRLDRGRGPYSAAKPRPGVRRGAPLPCFRAAEARQTISERANGRANKLICPIWFYSYKFEYWKYCCFFNVYANVTAAHSRSELLSYP
ncbi:hypothetical protein BDD14_0604 [Edaphobacter modestus]|uniref:Uncharacterized protein n=1 Tax=Edaphobacter modestus TaxID=388466 RepID=A0A4V6MFS8_9BACT|nr:hypothetical protein BDD14_0604 [Edaphobacter modestus]